MSAPATTCVYCPSPATTTRPTGVSTYFNPPPEQPRLDLCDPCALALDRDVRDELTDRAQEWTA